MCGVPVLAVLGWSWWIASCGWGFQLQLETAVTGDCVALDGRGLAENDCGTQVAVAVDAASRGESCTIKSTRVSACWSHARCVSLSLSDRRFDYAGFSQSRHVQ
jgi:hypothetical protein